MLYVTDASGVSDETLRRCLINDGPPFLFGSADYLPVGTLFELAGQLFIVIRISDREEFNANQLRRGLVLAPAIIRHFFEAATD
jgi:hypothetical protein